MSLPKRRHSRTRGRKRRGAKSLQPPTQTRCSECGAPIRPHTACPSCGTFKGKRGFIKVAKKEA